MAHDPTGDSSRMRVSPTGWITRLRTSTAYYLVAESRATVAQVRLHGVPPTLEGHEGSSPLYRRPASGAMQAPTDTGKAFSGWRPRTDCTDCPHKHAAYPISMAL